MFFPLHNGKDNLMTVKCKFVKRILLILRDSRLGTAEWVLSLLEQLQITKCILPKVILSDRDKGFNQLYGLSYLSN